MASLASLVSPADAVTGTDLERLAEAVRRLSPCHRDPERFHMDRAEIAGELRDLARRLGADDEGRGFAGPPGGGPPYAGRLERGKSLTSQGK